MFACFSGKTWLKAKKNLQFGIANIDKIRIPTVQALMIN